MATVNKFISLKFLFWEDPSSVKSNSALLEHKYLFKMNVSKFLGWALGGQFDFRHCHLTFWAGILCLDGLQASFSARRFAQQYHLFPWDSMTLLLRFIHVVNACLGPEAVLGSWWQCSQILSARHYPMEILPNANESRQEEGGSECWGHTCASLLRGPFSSGCLAANPLLSFLHGSGDRSEDSAAVMCSAMPMHLC